MNRGTLETREWSLPEKWFEVANLVVFAGGLLAAAWYFDLREAASTRFAWWVAMFVSIVAVRGIAGYAVVRAFGARLRFRPAFGRKAVNDSWWVAEGHRFTRRQYAAIGSIPYLAAAVAGLLYVAFAPVGELGAFLIVVYLLSGVRSLRFSVLALRQPRGTLFEEHAEGVRLHQPSGREA